jgi:deferrochelatase/peroxidase EfeB
MSNPGEPDNLGEPSPSSAVGLSRRSLMVRGGLLVGAGVVGGGVTGGLAGRAVGAVGTSGRAEGFFGPHQSGIVTDTQRHTVLTAFDVTATERADLVAVLKAWSGLGAHLVAGDNVTVPIYTGSASGGGDKQAPYTGSSAETARHPYADTTGPSSTDDSLEAYGLGPERLTLTIGFGGSLFGSGQGVDRFGIAHLRPAALVDLPHFSGDQLVAADSGGDLYVQACADDPQVAFHAVRSVARVAPDMTTLRWTQLGFSPSNTGGTPRNLMGFKDGTMNSNVHPPADLDATLWANREGPDWMTGGSYLVYRRIRITLEHWDRLAHTQQEQVIGRGKLNGQPLGGREEFDPIDLGARDSGGNLVIPDTAHVRLAAPSSNNGAVIVRRGFSYNNGTTPFVERWPPWRQALEYDSGLLFLGYQRDPRTAFVPVFSRLAENDALNQFTTHTASAVFAVPPGPLGPQDWIGKTLFT